MLAFTAFLALAQVVLLKHLQNGNRFLQLGVMILLPIK